MAIQGGIGDIGILGESFQWWMGQICDDSTWRDNILPYKFDSPNSITGWGYRYRVRIMGMHPKSNDILPSDKLEWASVMYGVTDGGGQGGTFTTPAIRPGNFVFGFFMGGDETKPMIMGILGNNSQTELQGQTELTGGKALEGISGFAEQAGEKGQAACNAGDGSLSASRPMTKDSAMELNLLSSGGTA